eukprot:scaffold49758_cov31-Tisochrysis_lutea.AAC.3
MFWAAPRSVFDGLWAHCSTNFDPDDIPELRGHSAEEGVIGGVDNLDEIAAGCARDLNDGLRLRRLGQLAENALHAPASAHPARPASRRVPWGWGGAERDLGAVARPLASPPPPPSLFCLASLLFALPLPLFASPSLSPLITLSLDRLVLSLSLSSFVRIIYTSGSESPVLPSSCSSSLPPPGRK